MQAALTRITCRETPRQNRLGLLSATIVLFLARRLLLPRVLTSQQEWLPPISVIDVPRNRLQETRLEGLDRRPAQFVLQLAEIDGVSVIVSGTVANVSDQLAMRAASATWLEAIEGFAN